MSNAIPLKFKYADPEVVSQLMSDALLDSTFVVLEGSDVQDSVMRTYISEMVSGVSLALFNAGCVIIQLDHQVEL